MSMQVQPYTGRQVAFDSNWIEQIILQLGDIFEIRIVWNGDTAVIAGVCALAGGLFGGYAGGRLGAALGAGIAGAAGLGVATVVSLREIWSTVKEKLKELIFIVYNFLRRLDAMDYVKAFNILMACRESRRELVFTILDFIASTLNKEVLSSITAA